MKILLILLLPISFDLGEMFPTISEGTWSPLAKACAKSFDPPPSHSYDSPTYRSYEPPSYLPKDEEVLENSSKLIDALETRGNSIKETFFESIVKNYDSSEWNSLPNETIRKEVFTNENQVANLWSNDHFFLEAENPVLLNAMPTTIESYKKVYKKRLVSQVAVDELGNYSNIVKHMDNIKSIDAGINELKSKIDLEDDKLVIIFAHSNNNGKRIVLPNGDELLDKDIHKYCLNSNKACVVLTCHGDDFGLTDKITTNEAFEMWDSAISLNKNEKISNIDFIYSMRKTRAQLNKTKRLKIYLSITGGSTVGIAYYYSSEQR